MRARNILLLISITIVCCVVSCNNNKPDVSSGQQRPSISPEKTVYIYEGDREAARVDVALAQTEEERNSGLMGVDAMPFNTGMLFLFDGEKPRSFWMVNTPLSLDILFINSNREIIRIRNNTTPYSDREITSEGPAQYVLEVNAGFTREYDIREGMRITWE